jgi:membrane-associated phospholipid phosphatase
MSTTVVVLLTGVVAGVIVLAIEALRGTRRQLDDIADPVAAEHWLVTHLASRPKLRAAVEHTDRRVAGGLAMAISLVMVFLAALVVGWVFESIDSGSGVARWDQSVAAWGPDNATTAAADFMRWVTRLGDTWLVFSAMAIVGVIDWRRRRNASSIWFLVTVGVGVTLVNNGLKLLIMRDRPPVDHLVGAAGSSFPSGHAAASAACWMAIALVAGRWFPRPVRPWFAVGAVVIAGFVAASRALLGVHWVSDVVAGVVVGWTWFLLAAVVFGGRLQRFGEPFEEVTALAHGDPHTLGGADPRHPEDDGDPAAASRGISSEFDGGRHGT